MDTSLYQQQKQFISYCETKFFIYVNFEFNPITGLNTNMQKILFKEISKSTIFGSYPLRLKTLERTPENSLQQQTLLLAIYMYILEDTFNVNDYLLQYGNSLVSNALLNIKFRELQPAFGMVGVDPKDTIDKYYQSLRYSLRDTETTQAMNMKHLDEDFKDIEIKTVGLSQYDVIFAFYGFNSKIAKEYHTKLLRSFYGEIKPTCIEYINTLLQKNPHPYKYFTNNRYGNMLHCKPKDLYFDDQDHVILMVNQIANSTFLNIITDDVNKYQYTPLITKDQTTGIVIVNGRGISTYSNLDDYNRINNISNTFDNVKLPNSFGFYGVNQNVITMDMETPKTLYGVIMKYDLENQKINNTILTNNVKSAVDYASGCEYGVVVEFVVDPNMKYVEVDNKFIEHRKLSKCKGDFITPITDCCIIKKLFSGQAYYIVNDALFNIDNITSIIYT